MKQLEAAIKDMKTYAETIDNAISVGLGAGDPHQWKMVAEISKRHSTPTCQSSVHWCWIYTCIARAR